MKRKFKGSAMIFALSILLITTILISILLSLNFSYSKINRKHIDYNHAINRVEEGFKLGLYLDTENYKGNKMNGTENIFVSKELWGCYFKVSSIFQLDSFSNISKIGLIGTELTKDYCLYLANNNSKLSLTGSTLIKGNCFLPEKGIGISYIEGKSFSRKKLIDGDVKDSKSSLPAINQFFIQGNKFKISGVFNSSKDSIISLSNLQGKNVRNSFFNKTLVIKSSSNILLDDSWNLKGNIIVHSSSRITIRNNARLENVILYAKEIVVEKGVDICSQLIAKDYIQIDNNSNLSYPSSLVTIGDSARINLLGNSSVSGTLISYSKYSNASNSISISKNATVRGLIYNTNKTELKGKVFGKLITKKLFHRSPSTEYSNTLIDAEINNSLLPYFYSVSSVLKDNNSPVNVIRWLK